MKKLLVLSFMAVVMFSCQQKQLFSEAPEIDFVNKANEAYLKQDWQTLRGFYADTAVLYVNTWGRNKLTPDQLIETFKTGLADIAEYRLSDDMISEMVITDNGQHYVHQWFEWSGKHKNGKEIRSVINISTQVENNKIVFAGIIYDTLPFYLAAQPDSAAVAVK